MYNPDKNVGQGWNVHPRPQMKRDKYFVLNDRWTLNGYDINMPYPPQSLLSGYEGDVGSCLAYETRFSIPEFFTEERILIHFGAVDQIAEVWLNGMIIGSHEGGYLPFTFDITGFVTADEENLLEVKVLDQLSEDYPYGKQREKRGGMWYTPVSGIWQSIWLENVPETYIENIKMTPDLEGIELCIKLKGRRAGECTLHAEIEFENGKRMSCSLDESEGKILIEEPRLWTVDDPYLYSMKVTAGEDTVDTYFALRTVDIRMIDGANRVCLNGQPVFLHGVLDQGYYHDGIYLPAEPAEYERDILRMKELGFNVLRKHIKIEPEWFYYYCDRHGMLVLQDMVNSGGYSFIRDTALPNVGFTSKSDQTGFGGKRKEFFVQHMKDMVEHLYNHPCIVVYTLFNEGWGQFESDALYDMMKALDGTRLINSTSGWFWQQKSDFDCYHVYFRNRRLKPDERPLLVGECGGYGYLIEDHYYGSKKYGYGTAGSGQQLMEKITALYEKMILPGIPEGVCGCIYTQLSDVEDEINGLYTYDRKICKVDKAEMRELAECLKL